VYVPVAASEEPEPEPDEQATVRQAVSVSAVAAPSRRRAPGESLINAPLGREEDAEEETRKTIA
jgi:hypothetical protein